MPKPDQWQFHCTITNCVDGDTWDIAVDVGFDIVVHQRVRVFGMNSPEVRSRDASERKRGIEAKLRGMELLPTGSSILIRTIKSGHEKYGRYLAEIILPDGRSYADVMISEGHAVAYRGGQREPVPVA